MKDSDKRNLEDKILSAFEEGRQTQAAEMGLLRDWWHFFNFSHNPLQEETILDSLMDPSFFQDKNQFLEILAKNFGSGARKEGFFYIALIGEYGAGKTTLITYFHRLLRKNKVNGRLVNFAAMEDLDSGKEYHNFLELIGNADYVILDNIFNIESLKSFLSVASEKKMLILSLWDAINYPRIPDLPPSKELFFPPTPRDTLIENLKRRLCLFTKEKLAIEDRAFEILKDNTYNNYLIVNYLVKLSFQIAKAMNSKVISDDHMSRAIKESLLVDVFDAKLTTKEEQLLWCIERQPISKTNDLFKVKQISHDLGWTEQLAWKYVQRLLTKGFLTKEEITSHVYYKPSVFYKIAWGRKRIQTIRKGELLHTRESE